MKGKSAIVSGLMALALALAGAAMLATSVVAGDDEKPTQKPEGERGAMNSPLGF